MGMKLPSDFHLGCCDSSMIPHFLHVMIQEDFFTPCLNHGTMYKSETNMFCLDCCKVFCSHCLCSDEHPYNHHQMLQIRRYMYNDVLLLGDAKKLMSCSEIQSYTTNGAKVLFLKQRPVTRPLRASSNCCPICYRALQLPYMYCSIYCKIHHLEKLNSENDTDDEDDEENLHECKVVEIPYEVSELGIYAKMTPDTVLESLEFLRTTSSTGSSATVGGGDGGVGGGGVNCGTVVCSSTIQKKRSNNVTVPRLILRQTLPFYTKVVSGDGDGDGARRRKGVPRRSPMC